MALSATWHRVLPSTTKTIQTSSVPLLWNPDVDSLSSRADANFARAAIRAGAGEAGALTANGWDNKRQGCTDFKNESAPSSRTFALTGSFAGGTPGDGSYSALWYGSGLTGPNGGLPGFPVIDPAFSTTAAAYYLPVYPGIESLDQLVYGVTFNTPVADPDEYLGPQANPFPYPAIDPDPTAAIRRSPATRVTPCSARARWTLRSQRPASRSIWPPERRSRRTPFPTAQGSQNIIVGKSGGEANLFGNIPGKGYGIDVTVSLATKINSIFRVQDQDVFDYPLIAGSRYPAGVFNCRQVWSGVCRTTSRASA